MPTIDDAAQATGSPEPLDERRRRARFRAWHRGLREMDLIMGRFADREMASLPVHELDDFERLMDEPDPTVLAWVMQRTPPPPEFDTPVLARLRIYRG